MLLNLFRRYDSWQRISSCILNGLAAFKASSNHAQREMPGPPPAVALLLGQVAAMGLAG